MTIHDILYSCGSIHPETLIFIIESGVIIRQCQLKELEPKYEMFSYRCFTISSSVFGRMGSDEVLAFKFYV